jgi:type II secretory pathway component GspD/PulD (secretin)
LFSVDQRTNSIIAAGTFEQLEVVNNILTVLDSAEVRERETRVHRLSNAFANNVVLAVNQWITNQRNIDAATGIITPFGLYQREVVIVGEPSTNNLIISGTPNVVKRIIDEVISPLDRQPPMVVIQVLIAELRLADTDEFGVELGLQDAVLFNRSLIGADGTAMPGFNFGSPSSGLGNTVNPETLVQSHNVGTQGVSNFAVGRINNELGFGGFVFSAQSESVNVLIRALQEKRRLEVLSRPQITALDAQPASIIVGQQVPIITNTQSNAGVGGQTNTYEYRDTGLQLYVVPLITPDDRVVMTITAIKSEVGPESEGIPIQIAANGQILRIPRIDNITAETVVSANSGQTVILGGLITTRKSDVHRRVPLLGDIPLIGDLFRYDGVNEVRNELLIILTPRVIRDPSDFERVKHVESSRMSWILSDVVALNGPSGLLSRCDEWSGSAVDSLYPGQMSGEGAYCAPYQPGMMPVQGPMMQSPMIQPMPGAIPPSNAPAPPPVQPDFTRANGATSGVTPAGYQTAAGAAATRLPTVK